MFPDFPDNNKNDDFLNEFRQKIAEQSNISFEERKNELNKSRSVFIGAVSGVVLAGIVGWFVLSPRYAQNGDVELPVIRRPQTAIKVQPTEPGGMEILNQDKSVYNILDKSEDNKKVVENLLPPPEQPKMPVIAPKEDAAPASINDVISQAEKEVKDTTVAEQAEKIVNVESAPKVSAVKNEPKPEETKTLAQATQELSATAPKAEPKKAESSKEAPKAEPVKSVYNAQIKDGKVVSNSEPSMIQNGVWQVQLISSNNKSSVEKSWKSLNKKYNMLSGLPYEIETADLGAKGVYYRLKAGAFPDRSGADDLCNDIKALGGTCFVKKK